MKSRWSDSEFRSVVDGYVRSGHNRDLATRVYTTRLLGGDPQLVLHGGGNKIVEAGLTVQVHYAFIGIKGDRSFLKKQRYVFIVADHLEMSESVAQPINRRGLLREHRRSLR